jgi:hypothetical protein
MGGIMFSQILSKPGSYEPGVECIQQIMEMTPVEVKMAILLTTKK